MEAATFTMKVEQSRVVPGQAAPRWAGPCWPEFYQTGAECRSLVGGSRTVAVLAALRLPESFSFWESGHWRQSEISDQDFCPFFFFLIHSALVFTLTVVIRVYLLYIVSRQSARSCSNCLIESVFSSLRNGFIFTYIGTYKCKWWYFFLRIIKA